MSNEDGTVWVVFNGEIYNYQELRRAARAARPHVPHRQRHRNDRASLRGLRRAVRRPPARHVRVRDLGHAAQAHCCSPAIGWASSRSTTRKRTTAICLRVRAEADSARCPTSIARSTGRPSATSLRSWRRPPRRASSTASRSSSRRASRSPSAGSSLRIERYWDVEFEPDEQFKRRRADRAAARGCWPSRSPLHQISDVPVGAFLSGGIDSSAVVATMAARQPGRTIKTSRSASPRTDYRRACARAQSGRGASAPITTSWSCEPDVVSIVEDLAWYLDEPFGDTSAIPTYMVSKLAAEHVKVVLTGDGGDELFAGYDKYVVERREREYDRVPAALRGLAGAIGDAMPEGMKGPPLPAASRARRPRGAISTRRRCSAPTRWSSCSSADAFEQVSRFDPWSRSPVVSATTDRDWMSAAQYCDLQTYLPLDILTKVDRMTMAHSIEARPPLLDHRLVEFAARFRRTCGCAKRTTKYLLKQAMRGMLPDDIIDRPQAGLRRAARAVVPRRPARLCARHPALRYMPPARIFRRAATSSAC